MIKNIFIPEHVGNYYIFPKRLVGVDIGKMHINATQLYLKGKQIVVEKFITVAIDTHNGNNPVERVAHALSVVMERVDRYDALHSALSSSLVVFKELKLPFIGREKIAMVLEFEVEPLLPFPLHDAVIDFIVTQENNQEKSSTVLVAAIQKTHLLHHLQPFEQLQLKPAVITVDFFALYGLYKQLPTYQSLQESVALIDLGATTTRIAYIEHGQLRFIRSVPKGVTTVAKSISDTLNLQLNEAVETLMRFGLERYDTPRYTQATTQVFAQFWQDIAFTLTSFTSQHNQSSIERIVLVGGGAEIKGIAQFVTTHLSIPCELLRINEVSQLPHVRVVNKNGIPLENSISTSAVFPTAITHDFNLAKKEFLAESKDALVRNQFIAFGALLIFLFGSMMAYSYLQVRKLKKEAASSEREVIAELTEQLPRALEGITDLEEAVETAKRAVDQEEKLWFSFANPNRTSFLTYLLELTALIDKKTLGFVIDKLVINENTIVMTAHVRDHKALALLEQALSQSKLFTIEKQQSPNFTMKIALNKGKK